MSPERIGSELLSILAARYGFSIDLSQPERWAAFAEVYPTRVLQTAINHLPAMPIGPTEFGRMCELIVKTGHAVARAALSPKKKERK